MATALNLPAHADIHEFAVMFTKSVKKKAKDWHDGYLKWHTFNFRAILYDDHRKPVANEFFPNRTISSNSDLEFSNAMVQIGDLTETLQANLEHVYRTPHVERESTIHTESSANFALVGRGCFQNSPVTPAPTRSVPKRIYPNSSTKSAQSKSIRTQADVTPPIQMASLVCKGPVSRKAQTKLSGRAISRTNRIYPLAQSQVSPAIFQQEALRPGWLAKADQELQQSKQNDATPKRNIRATRRQVGQPSRSQVLEFEVNKVTNPSENDPIIEHRTPITNGTAPSTLPCTPETPLPTTCSTNLHERASAMISEISAEELTAPAASRRSRLDPTRTESRRKPRKLLAAARHTSRLLDQSDKSVSSLEKQIKTAKPTRKVQNLESTISESWQSDGNELENSHLGTIEPPRQAIFDVELSAWVQELDLPNRSNRHQDYIPTEVESAIVYLPGRTPNPIIHHLGQIDLPQSCNFLAQSIEESEFIVHNSQPNRNHTLQPNPIINNRPKTAIEYATDEYGFLVAPPSKHKSFAPVVERKQKGSRRPVHNVIEQFPIQDQAMAIKNYNDDHADVTLDVEDAPRSPLFMPDSSQLSQPGDEEAEDSDEPGLYTQLAVRAAKQIARTSTIGKLAAVNKKRKLLQPKMCKKIHEVKSIEDSALLTKRPVASVCDAIVNSAGESEGPNNSLPATPSDIQTHDIDAMFQDHDQEIACARRALPQPQQDAISKVLQPVSLQPLSSVGKKNGTKKNIALASRLKIPSKPKMIDASSDSDSLRLATQINRRAPDFMSAKSFNSGAILELDRTIDSVGLSARELALLDMATQLSEPT